MVKASASRAEDPGLYQTPGVYVQRGSSKQFNSRSDISVGNSLSKVFTSGREQQNKGQS